jgi:dephospho-CoA kinase
MTAGQAKPVIGILGGIGAGKSTVAAELAALGCGVIDADAIGHQVLQQPQVRQELVTLWGSGVLDGQGRVSRPAVAEIVFADPAALEALNRITHPRIRRRIAAQVRRLAESPAVKAVVIDAALLLETDWQELCSVLVFVRADEAARRRRVGLSRGWDEETWRGREKSQKNLDFKQVRAEYVVDNSSSVSSLREQVRSIFYRIVQSADQIQPGS